MISQRVSEQSAEYCDESVDKNDCKQAWYANDSSAAGKLQEVKTWWVKLTF